MRRSSHRRSHISRRQVWCDRDDCRHLAVSIGGIELHNFYVPAGGDVPDPEQNPKFAHKLQFLGEMAAWARTDRLASRKAIVVGDLNVAPLGKDVWKSGRASGRERVWQDG